MLSITRWTKEGVMYHAATDPSWAIPRYTETRLWTADGIHHKQIDVHQVDRDGHIIETQRYQMMRVKWNRMRAGIGQVSHDSMDYVRHSTEHPARQQWQVESGVRSLVSEVWYHSGKKVADKPE